MIAVREIPVLTEDDKIRFWEKVKKDQDCWVWLGSKTPNGYGQFSIKRKLFLAHRISFVLDGGVFTHGPLVCHGPCNNRSCVNPDHLTSGSSVSNSRDCTFRDKTAIYALGEKHPSSKLTEKQVVEIRLKYISGTISFYRLADQYKVHHSTIARIVNRESWTHI